MSGEAREIHPVPANRQTDPASWSALSREQPESARLHTGAGYGAAVAGFASRDLARQRRLYSDLQRSEAFLAQGQRISHTGSFGWNVATDEIYWSEENYNILEYDRPTRATLDLAFQRIHPDDRILFGRPSRFDQGKEGFRY